MLEQLLDELGRRIPQEVVEPDLSAAAVALLLVADPDRLLLIRRADRPGDPWSGHLALPGGRREAHDVDLLATAIRETAEETGIQLDRPWCRAQLDDLTPRTPTLPPIMVRPFVFRLDEAVAPGTSAEVVRATWLELSTLTAADVHRTGVVTIRGERRTVEGYQLAEGFLWGMTERILSPVLARWTALAMRRPRPD